MTKPAKYQLACLCIDSVNSAVDRLLDNKLDNLLDN
jgi:hypothetical protein